MKIIEKDILSIDRGIICHQTNCQGVMGTGIALSIKNRWPNVYNEYIQYCRQFSLSKNVLGNVQIIRAEKDIYVVNLFGQDKYGRDKRYTSYGAWEKSLPRLKEIINAKGLALEDIYFPYKCGCNNAGGDWEIISRLIEEYFPNAIICKYDKS